jgi:hypothetical protein
MLGVSRSTICRDVRAILARNLVVACPTCDSVLLFERAKELEKEGRGRVTVTDRRWRHLPKIYDV